MCVCINKCMFACCFISPRYSPPLGFSVTITVHLFGSPLCLASEFVMHVAVLSSEFLLCYASYKDRVGGDCVVTN